MDKDNYKEEYDKLMFELNDTVAGRALEFLNTIVEETNKITEDFRNKEIITIEDKQSIADKYANLIYRTYTLGESGYVSGVLRTVISERKLQDHESEIMLNFNAIVHNNPELNSITDKLRNCTTLDSYLEMQQLYIHARVEFGKNYIDQWQKEHPKTT